MAKGFRRSGEWQTGFSQRTPSSDVNRQKQYAAQIEKRAKEEIAKRVQSAAEQRAEEQRITNNYLRVSNYEAQQAAQFSKTLQNLLSETIPSIAKTGMTAARAQGSADRVMEELAAPDLYDDTQSLDPDDEAFGNFGTLPGRGFDSPEKAIDIVANKQLDITQKGNKLAEDIENSTDPFKDEKARRIRGIFSGAYTYGYQAKDKALKVEGFSAYLDNALKIDDTQLLDGNVPFSVNDPNLTKKQLAIASNYVLDKWTQENRGDLNDQTTAELLVTPARKVMKENLKKRYADIDAEFNASQLAGLDNLLDGSLDGSVGFPSLNQMLPNYINSAKPFVSTSKNKSKGAIALERLQTRVEEAFKRSSNPDLLEDRINAALNVKTNTPAGFKSLAELHQAKFSPFVIKQLKQKAVVAEYNSQKAFQEAVVKMSVENYIDAQEKLSSEERDTEQQKSDFVESLHDKYPFATQTIIDSSSRIFLDPSSPDATVRSLKATAKEQGGVITAAQFADPTLDIETKKEFLEANPNIKVLPQLYPSIEKDDVERIEKDFKSFLAGLNDSFVIDTIGGVKDPSGTFTVAYNEFLSEIKFNAYAIQKAAKDQGQVLTFTDSLQEALKQFKTQVIEANTSGAAGQTSRYYVTTDDRLDGGFQNLYKEKYGGNPYKHQYSLPEKINDIKINNTSADKKITKNVDIDDNGGLKDLSSMYIAQSMSIPQYDFSVLQNEAFGLPIITKPENYDLFKNSILNSEAGSKLMALQSKGNTSTKVVKRLITDLDPFNAKTITQAFIGMNFEDVVKNEITAQGLELDAGQVQTINGEKHFGNRYIGISANGKFGVKRDPEKLPEGASNPHNGLDVGTTGKEGFFTAFKIQDGVVTDNRSDKVLGVTIEITAPDGTAYRFNHLKNYNPKLKIGAAYNGEIIGEIGNTGASTDIHLDIQKRVNGELVDPLPDMDKLSIGKRLEQTIGKYPFTRSMILKLTKDRDEDNPLSGLNYAKALNRYRQDEVLQKELWEYFNAKSFSAALTKANGDLHLAARYHVANVLRGDMDKFNLPTINAFANQYIQKLRTQGVLP
tara:strand:+ start:556 stop:3759 length:3204 start_codon:yes stop_codon:yes gene_type:complete